VSARAGLPAGTDQARPLRSGRQWLLPSLQTGLVPTATREPPRSSRQQRRRTMGVVGVRGFRPADRAVVRDISYRTGFKAGCRNTATMRPSTQELTKAVIRRHWLLFRPGTAGRPAPGRLPPRPAAWSARMAVRASFRALVAASNPPALAEAWNPRWKRSAPAATAATATVGGHHGHGAPVGSRRRTAPPPSPAVCSRVAPVGSHRRRPSGQPYGPILTP
jgi:hypothetical protein